MIELDDNITNWNELSKDINLSINIIDKYENKLNWILLSKSIINNSSYLEICRKHKEKINWNIFTFYKTNWNKHNLNFLREFKKEINWVM